MVDIIIPVYNALDTLELAVTSALMQGDVRILLVDDGSTDGTARLCDELAHHPRIAVIHQQNRGVSAARNAGLQAAASEWLTFLDADDVLLPDAIGHLLALAGDSQAIQGLVTRSEAPDVPECTVQTLSSRDMLDLALRNPTVHLHTHGWLLRREICNERFNESLRLGEDGEWMMRVPARHENRCAGAGEHLLLPFASGFGGAQRGRRGARISANAHGGTANIKLFGHAGCGSTVPLDAPAADADARGGAGGRLSRRAAPVRGDSPLVPGSVPRGFAPCAVAAAVKGAGGAADAAVRAVSAGTAGDSDSAQAESAGVCIGRKRIKIGSDFSQQDVLRTARGKSAVTCGLSRAERPHPSLRRRFHQLESHGTSALARR